MQIQTKHISTLIGRVFLFTTPKALKDWGGADDEEGQSDYDSITEHINAEEAGLHSFSKGPGLEYLTFFSMSSKIEIFKSANGIVIFEGLFFNESWDYSNPIIIEDLEETSKRINIDEELLVIVNAAANGRNYPDNSEHCAIQFENGDYKVTKVQIKIEIDNNNLERMGIVLSKISLINE